jgi:hypothetical protein
MDTPDKPRHSPTQRNRALLGHAISKSDKITWLHLVPTEETPERIKAGGWDPIDFNGPGMHRVIMVGPEPEAA